MKLEYNNLILDTYKFYCNACISNNILTEMESDPLREGFLLPPSCGHFKRGFHKVSYQDKFVVTIGLKKSQLPKSIPLFEKACDNCNHKWTSGQPVNNYTCPECGYIKVTAKIKNFLKHCDNCGFEELSTKPLPNWTCPECNTRKIVTYINKCGKCNFEEETRVPMSVWRCPECDFGRTFANIQYCKTCKEETKHYGDNCEICIPRLFGFGIRYCEVCQEETNHNGSVCFKCSPWNTENIGFKIKYCEVCQEEVKHLSNVCTVCFPLEFDGFRKEYCETETLKVGTRCFGCNPRYYENGSVGFSSMMCEVCNKNTIHLNGNCGVCNDYKIFSGNIYCEKCDNMTPHKDEECLVCSGDKIYCEYCKYYGDKTYHSNPDHRIFYKAITRNWLIEHPEQIESINWFTKDDLNTSGIYGWFVLDKPIYIGQSTDIFSRSLDHLYNIYHYPEHFFYKEEFGIELRVLEECNKEEMNEKELLWIEKLKPIRQKCDGIDHIKSLN